MKNPLRHVSLPVKNVELYRMRTRHPGSKDNSLRLREILNDSELVPPAVSAEPLVSVGVGLHALEEMSIHFRKYVAGARQQFATEGVAHTGYPDNVEHDLDIMAKTGYVLTSNTPGRKDAHEDRVITHEFPVWDAIQLVVGCYKGLEDGLWRGKIITLGYSPSGKPSRSDGHTALSSRETQGAIHSLRTQGQIVTEAVRAKDTAAALTAIGKKLLSFEGPGGVRGWGTAYKEHKTGKEIISVVSAHQILDLLLLYKRHGAALPVHMARICGRYGMGATSWTPAAELKMVQKAGLLFGVRAYPPDPRTLDLFLVESLIYRELDRTGALR